MNPILKSSRSIALLASAAAFSATPTVQADLTKANNIFTLDLATSWTDGTLTPTSADILIWNNTVLAANNVSTAAPLSAAGLKILDPGGLVTINSTATNTITLGASGIDMSSATQNLTLAGAGPVLNASQEWKVAAGRSITVSGAGTNLGANILTLSGDGNFTFNNTVSNSGSSVIKSGTGTLFVSANVQTKSFGNIALNGGAYEQNHQNAIGGGTITAANGTSLYLNGPSFTNAGLAISSNAAVTLQGTGNGNRRFGNYTLNDGSNTTCETRGGTGTATFISNGNITLNGNVILNATTADVDFSVGPRSLIGGVSLTKTGNGKLTLGTVSAYTGNTFVNGGTLGGIGTLGGSVTVASGAILAPGTTGIGSLTTGALSLSSGSSLAIQINTNSATADRINVTGLADLTGTVNLTLSDLGTNAVLASGTKLVIVDYTDPLDPADLFTINGNLAADGATVVLGANSFIVDYNDPALDGTAFTLSIAAGGDPYSGWADSFSLVGADRSSDADPDFDGLENGIEFVVGGNPSTNTPAADRPTSVVTGGNLIFSFKRSDISESFNVVVEHGTTLETWPGQIAIPAGEFSDATVTVINNDPGLDQVTVTIPVGSDPKKFVRLRAVIPAAP